MKKALKIALFYFLFLQLGALIAMPFLMVANLIQGNSLLDMDGFIIIGQFIGMGLMMIYLWWKNYLYEIKVPKSVITPSYMLLSVLMILSCMWLLSVLMSQLTWIPNIMEQTFDELLTSWWGILMISVAGPVVEEYVFRGAITRSLLEKYNPTKSILISAAIFGIFHINPAQILPAFLIGIVLAWVYYRTASLKAVIIMHIINNSISTWLMIKYPDVQEVNELLLPSVQAIITIAVVTIFYFVYASMKKVRVDYDWKEDKVEPIEIANPTE